MQYNNFHLRYKYSAFGRESNDNRAKPINKLQPKPVIELTEPEFNILKQAIYDELMFWFDITGKLNLNFTPELFFAYFNADKFELEEVLQRMGYVARFNTRNFKVPIFVDNRNRYSPGFSIRYSHCYATIRYAYCYTFNHTVVKNMPNTHEVVPREYTDPTFVWHFPTETYCKETDSYLLTSDFID